MQWLVEGKDSSVVFTAELLIQQFLATKEIRDDHRFIGHTLAEELQRVNTLSKMAPDEIAALGCFIGYYFRVFIEQNKVEVQHVDSSESNAIEASG